MQPQTKNGKLLYKNLHATVKLLPVEIWELIFSTLFYSIDVKDQSVQRQAFLAANGLNTYLRGATSRVRKGMIMHMVSTSMDSASRKGDTDLLDWWLYESGLNKTKLELYYTPSAIGYAAEYNQINVLNWWNQSGLFLKYDKYALEKATERSNTEVLDWWRQNNWSFIYSKCPLDIAILNNAIDIAEWWIKKSGQPMCFHLSPNTLIKLKLLVL